MEQIPGSAIARWEIPSATQRIAQEEFGIWHPQKMSPAAISICSWPKSSLQKGLTRAVPRFVTTLCTQRSARFIIDKKGLLRKIDQKWAYFRCRSYKDRHKIDIYGNNTINIDPVQSQKRKKTHKVFRFTYHCKKAFVYTKQAQIDPKFIYFRQTRNYR